MATNYVFRLKLNINSCISFQSNYNPFDFRYRMDLYHYGSKQRKLVKNQFQLSRLVEDHHIIPKSFERHPLLIETKFPIHCSKNIKMMPSIKNHNISHDILIHTSHYNYNRYMRDKLDEIYEEYRDINDKKNNILLLLEDMYKKLNYKESVPWK